MTAGDGQGPTAQPEHGNGADDHEHGAPHTVSRRTVVLGVALVVVLALLTVSIIEPDLYALGTLTTVFSLLMIGIFLLLAWASSRRKAKAGTDAGKGMV